MTLEIWLTFVFTASVILAIPGPTIIYVISQSLTHGRKAIMPLAAGVTMGDTTCILFSLLGLSALLAVSSLAFTVLKIFGAAYLIALGVSTLKNGLSLDKPKVVGVAKVSFSKSSLFKNAYAITSLNPKGIIFHSAFMPQFINPDESSYLQFGFLGLTFLALALINTLIYSLMAGAFGEVFASQKVTNWFGIGGGFSLIGAGVLTLASNRK